MSYVLEVAWGCPSDRYPLNGIFQFDQAQALRDAGLDIVYLALDLRSIRRWRKWGVNRTERAGIPVYEYNFPCGPMKPALKYKLQDHAFARAISAIEAEFGQPQTIHVHTCQQAISAVDYCEEKNIPYVITEHITPLDEGASIEARKRSTLHGAKHVIAVSNALGRDLKNTYGVDSITIPNIVDLSEFGYVNKKKNDHIRFLSAASMNYGKGFDILIRAYAKLLETTPDCSLTIMGDGSEMPAIRSLATQLGIREIPYSPVTSASVSAASETQPDSVGATSINGTITFTGTYVRSEFAAELARSDIFVLPSRSETFGLVYAEALAAGIPVIATACGGPEDFIDDSNGLLVPVDDVDALADAMRRMTDTLDTYDRGAISDACKARFSPSAIATALKPYLT